MKKTALAALAAIATLSVSACTSGTVGQTTADGAAASTPVPVASTPAPTATSTPTPTPSSAAPTMAKPAPGMESPDETRQDDASNMLNMWLTFEGAHKISDFHKPYKFITGWSSPAPDVYAFTVDNAVEKYAAKNGSDVKTELRKIGASFWANPVGVNYHPKSVHVSTEDGKYETTVR